MSATASAANTDSASKSSATPGQAHFLFEPEHDAFRAEVRRFVESELDPYAEEWDQAGRIPRSVFARVGAAGLFGLMAPKEYGGIGGDCRNSLVMAEEMSRCRSRGTAMGIGAHAAIAMPHLIRFGTDEQKQRYLADLVAGTRIAALGVTEPTAGSNVAGMKTTATRNDQGWLLRGEKMYITNSLNADLFFIAAKTDAAAAHRGISMFLVDRKIPGFQVEEMRGKLGRLASDTGHLTFTDCQLPADALLGGEGHGFYQIMQCFENERLMIAGGCIGVADVVLEETFDYVKQRRMGPGTLADMQVTKQRLAKSVMELEAARQLTYYCAWRVVRGIPSLKEVAMAKAQASETAFRVVDDCLQLHGGSGYFDSVVERAYRDIRLDRIGGGATEVMYEIIAKQLGI